MRSLRTHLLGAAAIFVVLVQLAVLYWPVVTVTGPVSWSDKVVHLAVFAVPTTLVGWATRRFVLPVAVFLVHAPVSELVQHYLLPGRTGDVWDAVLDVVGVAVGAVVLVVGRRLHRW
jgi:hypothetical protein